MNRVGQRIGRLIIREKTSRPDKPNKVFWLCECDCGKTITRSEISLLSHPDTSCGCLRAERLRNTIREGSHWN
jgi:hypothetical protein